jgi:sugar-phosphatase
MVTADDVAHGKPDPECFTLAAGRLGVAAASCAVLEDSPAGIAAGRAAGAYVIALRTTHRDDELSAADAIVDDLAAL